MREEDNTRILLTYSLVSLEVVVSNLIVHASTRVNVL